MLEQANRYGQISAEPVLNDHHEQGGRKFDLDHRQDRRAFVVERLQDDRKATTPVDTDRNYDLDDHRDRVRYMTERLNGKEFENAEGSA